MCALAAVIVIALWLAFGQGIAAAAPSDPSDSSPSQDTTSISDKPDSADTSGQDDPDPEPEPAPSSADADDADDADDTDGTDEAVVVDTDTDEATETDTDKSTDNGTDEATETDTAVSDEVETSTTGAKKSRSSLADGEEPAEDSALGTAAVTESDAVTADTDPPAAQPDAVASLSPEPTVATTTLAAPPIAQPRTLRSVVSARPVTVNSIVTDLLTWVGLRSLADDAPAPATPVSSLMEALWLVVRQSQYALNNQRPTADAMISGPGPDGVVTGNFNAVDYDDAALAYIVTAGPERGSVAIDALGHFTYTPDAGKPLRGDRFTVTIDDTVGNPFHIHGLFGLLGITGPTEVTIVVAAPTPVRAQAAIDLGGLVSREGVAVTINDDGSAKVIDGRFTDYVVTGTADAAAVMNAFAPALGVTAGFADPTAITATEAGTGRSVEHFYRLTETISGITVLGSDVILVTDAAGAVTGLFNNYVGLSEDFDVTPASSVDDESEIQLIAGVAYLGSGAGGGALESLLAQSTFTDQLVVYALDDDAAPDLAWQVILQLPDTGDMSQPGATYLIDADGTDAGAVIVAASHVQEYTSVGLAEDWLGQQRTITFDIAFFRQHTLVDATRGITTYKTSYTMFGQGGPVLPGNVVNRGWFGWDTSAISAHANTAVVYDYYADVLGRTSFDGEGAPIVVSIRFNPISSNGDYANAFWDPSRQQFAFGDSGYLQAALDVVGHEFTHAVVSYAVGNGGPTWYYNESGALNEAYADVLGALIEGKSGPDRWLVGEDSDFGTIRNLADPTSIVTVLGPYRDNYATRYTGADDDGGEHINSTIFSHAAYKMITDPVTSGVSDEMWATVFYQSLYRLSPGAIFTDARAAVLSTATALEFTTAQLGAIRDAFDSVGIFDTAAALSIAA